MTEKHRAKRVAVTAVRVHPLYYHTIYGAKQRFQHFLNQLSRLVSMVFFGACFVQWAFMAAQIPAIIHLPMLALLLAAVIFIGNQINISARGRANFKRFDKLKKSSVIYTRTKKVRCSNDNEK